MSHYEVTLIALQPHGESKASHHTPQPAKSVVQASTLSTDDNDSGDGVARSAGVVSLAVLGSRLLGLVREQVMAAFFGAGFLTDAFNVGFRIPNILRDLFAEGALSVAFVKTFTQQERQRSQAEAWRLASLVMNALTLSVSVIVVFGIIFAPQIVSVFAYGFSPEKTRLAVTLTRLMLPFLPLVALAAVAMGVLNTKGRFGIPASASTLFNVGAIIGGLLFAYAFTGGSWKNPEPGAIPDKAAQWAVVGMAVGTLIGGCLQFLLQVPALRAVGFRFLFVLSFRDPGVRQVLRLMAPAVVGTASVQLNVFVNSIFASSTEGAISWLNFSFRLLQFPIGLFGVALGTATLPAISRLAIKGDINAFRSTLASSIGLIFFLSLPSACGFIILGEPIIRLIYQRGEFTAFDTEMVTATLAAYSLGLMGYAALKVLSPAFYALDDARTPVVVSILSIGLNALTSYYFFHVFSKLGVTPTAPHGYGHVGLALSTSIVTLLSFTALAFSMRRKLFGLDGRKIISSLWRITLSSLALCLAAYYTHRLVRSALTGDTLITRLAETFVPIFAGAILFLLTARLLRTPELHQVRSMMLGSLLQTNRKTN